MKEIVLITGANGMLAKKLALILNNDYHIRFLTRNVRNENEFCWNVDKNYINPKAIEGVNHIIHLAGSPIADKPWTQKRRLDILDSRVKSADLIRNELVKNSIVVDSFISASAVGFYGTETTEKIHTEESPRGSDFLSNVCVEWENVANSFKTDKIASRVCIIRIGIILDKNGGALKKIIQSINYGFGAVIGRGNQWMPWIHIIDLRRMFKFLLKNKNINGVFNGVAPNQITNKELTHKTANLLGKKLILPNIAEFIVRIIFGKRSLILLKGSRVSSEKIMNEGFTYKFNTIDKALQNIMSEK